MKRLAILCMSFLFLGGWKLLRSIRRLAGLQNPGTCVVLYYHQVRPEDRAAFGRQMDILLRSATATRADRTEPLNANTHYAAVTFDDGYQNIIDNALPELQKRGIPATLFIITEALGRYPDWLTNPNDSARLQMIVSPGQLRQLPPEVMDVGSHTMTHLRLTTLSEERAKHEIAESRVKLEEILKREIKLFSFPFGAMNQRLVELCLESGYARVFSISPTLALRNPAEFITGRVSVEPTDWTLEFRLKVMGAYQWLPAIRDLKRRVLSSLAGGASSRRRLEVGVGQ